MGRVAAWVSVLARIGAVAGCCLALAHCGKAPSNKYGVSASPRVVQLGEPVPKGGGVYRVGKPYTIAGRTYVPEENAQYVAEGIASWYGEDFHGRRTANGEVYDMASVSAAHPTLPIPSYVRITNLGNRRSVIARVNDRGPYHQDRVIDVSVRAAKLLGFHENGTARVRVEYVGLASLGGSDDDRLAATLRRGTPAPSPSEVRMASARARGQDDAPPRVAEHASQSEVTAAARRPASRTAAETRAAAPSRTAAVAPQSSFDARFGPIANPPAAAQPMSAYAPAANMRSSTAVVSGRGLY
jgi:rare lipoprotein A